MLGHNSIHIPYFDLDIFLYNNHDLNLSLMHLVSISKLGHLDQAFPRTYGTTSHIPNESIMSRYCIGNDNADIVTWAELCDNNFLQDASS